MLAVVATSVACSGNPEKRGFEYVPDMARTAAYKSFTANPITHNGLTLQPAVPGTIARESQPFHYGATPEEAERAGRELHNPLPSTPAVLRRGQALYGTFCLVCHGVLGQGNGPLVPKIPTPPSYTSARVLAMRSGQIFHIITLGSGRMPSYASQINPDERWQIVAYVDFLRHSNRQHN